MSIYKIPDFQVFENKVKDEFSYLITEFFFSKPVILSKEEEYRDRLVFIKANIAIEVLNSWHPNDYGFEVNYYSDRSFLNITNDQIQTHIMIYYKLKEQQTEDLSFISEGAKMLKQFFCRNNSN